MTKRIIKCLWMVGAFKFQLVNGQMATYTYKRPLANITDTWHKIVLPTTIFQKATADLRDIRIYGITSNKDTIESPYILKQSKGSVSVMEIPFKIVNESYNSKGYYYTFEVGTKEAINQIKLDFQQQNFDWQIQLEGSNNQSEWFTIANRYRILSIKNETTDFQFTKLSFPSSNYRYFRLFIPQKENPSLKVAKIFKKAFQEPAYINYPVRNFQIKEHKGRKQTEIQVVLNSAVPLSCIDLKVKKSFDFYRPITIMYLSDSVKTEQGWVYNYSTLTSGILNSIEKNEFTFNSTVVQQLKIYIDNQDNQPLFIDTVQVKGFEFSLLARFTEPATYFLAYGNPEAPKPNYDIEKFIDIIPNQVSSLQIGDEMITAKQTSPEQKPLITNIQWLWVLMGCIMLVLGWFTLKMIQQESSKE